MGADPASRTDTRENNFLSNVSSQAAEEPAPGRNTLRSNYNHAVAEALTERKARTWVLFSAAARRGRAGCRVFWSGDNDANFSTQNGLPTVVTAGLNAGMSACRYG